MVKNLDVKDALQIKDPCFVDVRSPSEYLDATIPGAVNVPLFDDSQRRFIGLTYRERGVSEAKLEGLRVVAPRLPGIVEEILHQCGNNKLVVFCWRGGMRSQTVASILDLVGMPSYRLEGGYKAFRRFVLSELENFDLKPQLVVLDGLTGVGKTLLLHRLKERGHPILDLENLAGHRGSVFGDLGPVEPRGQKMFDALLWQELQKVNHMPYLLVEGESKKIGQIFLPEFLYLKMQGAKRIKVEASMPVRVERLLQEYAERDETDFQDHLFEAINKLTRRLGGRRVEGLRKLLEAGRWKDFVENLLTQYYDPLYRKSELAPEQYLLVVSTDELEEGVKGIEGYLREKYYHEKNTK